MKRCPQCGREYDNTMMFCLDDGTELLYGPANRSELPASAGGQFDEPQTAILHSTAPPSEAPTRAQIHTTEQTAVFPRGAEAEPRESFGAVPEKQSFSANKAAKPLIASVVAIAVLLGGFFGYRYFNQSGGGQINSIAVMPFVNESKNEEFEYLSDGMTETLIKSLSELPNLNVKPRATVFRYKGKDTDLKTIGKELNVEAILSGRVVQRGEQLTLSLELVDVQNDKVLWTESYNRKQSDLVTLQSEIARDVSTKLKSKLSGADEAKVIKSGTASPEAYQAYLKGRYYWNKRDPENLKKAIEQFDLAVQKDPNYALAYVGLADSYGIAGNFPGLSVKESLPRAKAYAAKALEIDDSLGEAYATLGLVNALQWNWAEAETAYKRSIELNPNYATARQWYARLLNTLGRKDEALAEIKRANEIDPLSAVILSNVAGFYRERGDYQTALEQNNKIIEIDPNYIAVHVTFAEIYLDQKRPAEALAAAEKARDIPVVGVGILGRAYAQLGRRDEALAVIKTLEEDFAKGNNGAATSIARIYIELGDKEKTFEWLEKAFQARETDLPRFRLGPTFDPIRDDPRYEDLLKRMNLPE
ncbi:MAG: tetratricopeptide repeat protein [Acidobacteria bacterium]|nr:tetratricopeptide repeat protein [Acidobacteriota bacterium]